MSITDSCSIINAKIMQTESRDASLLAIFAEVQLILCKGNRKILMVKNLAIKRYVLHTL